MTAEDVIKGVWEDAPEDAERMAYANELFQEAIRLGVELNNQYHTPEEIREIMGRLTGKEIAPDFRLFPPFYTDFGKNITIGRDVFINSGCHFQDQGGIEIGDGALIGHNVIIPFCTSHSSGIGSSDTHLHTLASGASWLAGRRFAGGTSRSTVEDWISGLALPQPETEVDAMTSATSKAGFNFETKSVTLNSGYEMPINGLGTYSLHGETCVNSVKSALASGVRFIDTASAYGNEEEVGQAVREAMEELGLQREDIFVITKIYPGSEMANPEQAIQACLDRLDLGYVDMMLLHHPDRNDVKAYQAMEKFVEDGKIRSLGLSNWYVEELEEFLPQVAITPALVQNEIHPYYQENDVIPCIQDLGIVVQGWYPLGGRGHTAELLGDEVISGIAQAHGVSSAQVILRWNLQKGVVVIPGSSNPDHIRENTELYDFKLTEAEMAQINALDRNEKHDWY